MMILVMIMLIMFGAPLARATTYYVATDGSDAATGLSESVPFRTVGHCAGLLVAGDTCYVRGGTYTTESTIQIKQSGTAELPIVLANYPGETPVISYSAKVTSNRIYIRNVAGDNVAMGFITVEGFEISGGWEGIKFFNLYNSTIRRNYIHDGHASGIFGAGGHHVTITQNIISHQGGFAECAAGTASCTQEHGMYLHGQYYTITRNIVYDNLAIGIQQNGSSTSSFTTARHPDVSFSGANNWIISDNTIAYNHNGPAIVIWGSLSTDGRYENNICYENQADKGTSSGQCFFFTSPTSSTNAQLKNNHSYASGSGGQAFVSGSPTPTEGVNYTQSGNVINVTAPAFVNGGSNALPVGPNFSLTASAPVNIALTNEFLNNSTAVVGAFKTVANPTASIKANIVTLTFPMNTAVPILIPPSSIGVSISCTGSACPSSPTVGSASGKTGSDSQVEVVINGITSNACVASNQTWTISYSASTGSWTGFDNIGPMPGLQQKIFSFSSLAVTNQCDGTGPGSTVGTPIIMYDFSEGTGVTTVNTGSAGSGKNGTLANGAGWTTGKTGFGVNITGGTQQVQVPYGFTGGAINPSTQSMTWALAVKVPSGGANASRYEFGTQIGVNQRAYVGSSAGTWGVASQSTSVAAAGVSNLVVDEGWNHLCVTWDSASDVVTLYKNGVAGTGGATRAYTSFTLQSDILLGITGSGFPAVVSPGVYDDFLIYTTVEDCAAIYAAWNATATTAAGTFGMPASRFQAVYLPSLGGSPTSLGTAINQPVSVVNGGAVAVLLELFCENVSNCDQDSFRLEAQQNGTGAYLQVPNAETATHIFMWGADTNVFLNAGITTSRLSAGSCTVTNGSTLLTSSQVPVIDLPQNGCVVLRYIVRIGVTASGFYNLRLSHQNGASFTGTVTPARIDVVSSQAVGGF